MIPKQCNLICTKLRVQYVTLCAQADAFLFSSLPTSISVGAGTHVFLVRAARVCFNQGGSASSSVDVNVRVEMSTPTLSCDVKMVFFAASQ